MLPIKISSLDELEQLAFQFAKIIREGNLVFLTGPMGAGKTTFVKLLAKATGSSDIVTSPTFVLVRHYSGQPNLTHADLYRLETKQEIRNLCLEDFLDDSCVLVEWGEMGEDVLGKPHYRINFQIEESGIRYVKIESNDLLQISLDGLGSK